MIHTLFHSDDLPPGDRFDQWCEVTEKKLQPKRVLMQRGDDFHGSIRALALGAVLLADLAYTPLLCHREPVHVRRVDEDTIQFHLITRGTAALDFDQHQESATVGEMLVHDSSHPYTIHTRTPGGVVEHLTLSVPRRAVTARPRHIDGLLGRRLPAEGTGAILSGLLKDTYARASRGGDLRSQEAERLGDAASSLVSAIIARYADAQTALPAETRHDTLVQCIHAFIDAHLADPGLGPQMVADAHHVSVRHLHRLFQRDGTSVGAWIKHRRLERCLADLADPAQAARPIHAIAARRGFPSAAEFSRAFRAAYGVTATEYRSTGLHA